MAMDLTEQLSSHHKLKKTLKVKLRSIKKELKLDIKIDKSLVHVPEAEERLIREKIKRQKTEEEGDICKRQKGNLKASYLNNRDTGTIDRQAIAATLLNLAEYAHITPLVKTPSILADEKHKFSSPETLSLPSDAKNNCQDQSQETQTSENCDKCFETPEGEEETVNRSSCFKYCPMHSCGYLPNMESEVSDNKLGRQQNTSCSETVDLSSGGRMVLTTSVVNNNQRKPVEDAPSETTTENATQSAVGVDISLRVSKCITENSEFSKPHLSDKSEVEGNNSVENGEKENNSEHMVTEVPLKELSYCQGLPNSKDEDLGTVQEGNHISPTEESKVNQLQDARGQSNGCNQEVLNMKMTNDNSHDDFQTKCNDSSPVVDFSEELQEANPALEGQSEHSSIGQQVDDEIKALLAGSNLRNRSDTEECEEENEQKKMMEIEVKKPTSLGRKEDNCSLETADREMGQSGHSAALEVKETLQTDTKIDVGAVNNEQRRMVSSHGSDGEVDEGDGRDGNLPQPQEPEPNNEQTVVLLNGETEERQSMDGDRDEDQLTLKGGMENGKIAESESKSQGENSTGGFASHEQNSGITVNESKSQENDNLITSASQPYQGEVHSAGDDEVRSENSEEHKVGRKGLKQEQSQSLLEAEVTSEFVPTSNISHIISEGPSSEARSQSVIVRTGNPRTESGLDACSDLKDEDQQAAKVSHDTNCEEVAAITGRKENNLSTVDDREASRQDVHTEIPVDHPELFQALTPPPPSVALKSSHNLQMLAQRIESKENLDGMRPPNIQITSIRTLAPLTNTVQSRQSSVDGNRPIPTAPSHLLLNRPPHPDSLVDRKELMQHNVILQGPPVARLQNPEVLMRTTNVSPSTIGANHLHLVDLSKEGIMPPGLPLSDEERERVMVTMHHTLPENSGPKAQFIPVFQDSRIPHVLGQTIKEEKTAFDYNHEEQQQHFLEIKRHLLTSKANASAKEVGSMPRMVPAPMNGLNTRPVISVAPVTKQETLSVAGTEKGSEDSKPPSPIGKFSGAMMEHVRHWKEQNERNNQCQTLPAVTKMPPTMVPIDASAHTMVYPSMVPSLPVAPLVPVDHPTNFKKSEKVFETPSEINHGLLENLQALHKMYFKTMQGTEKVIFPKMSPKKPGPPMPGSVPEMVQVVKPFMPPAIQPQMIPRFPPESQIPPELLSYHMNVVARNNPATSPISPTGRKVFPPQMIPTSLVPERYQHSFADLGGRFPRPPFPISHMEQISKSMGGSAELIMVPPKPSSQFPLSPHLQLSGKSQSLPRELMNPAMFTTAGPQGVPMMLLPPGTKFLPEKGVVVCQDVGPHHPKEQVSPTAKRKAEDGAPLDLSTSSAKVRRVHSNEDLTLGDQPMDLSIKSEKVKDVPTVITSSVSLPMSISYPGFSQAHHMGLASNNQSLSPNFPQRFLVPPQFLGGHSQGGLPNLGALLPQRMPIPGMGGGTPHLISSSANASFQRLPLVNSQHHLPTVVNRMHVPEHVEMMKLVSRNTSQLISRNLLPTANHAAVLPNNFTDQILTGPPTNSSLPTKAEGNAILESRLDLGSVKRKRGRPKGSTNKRRLQPVIHPPLEIIETASNPVSTPVSISSEIAECQFCDFKAASRGDVRQHVKVVHFAKFRRDSSKSVGSCDPLTPEYTSSIEQQLPISPPGDKVGEWTAVTEGGKSHHLVREAQVCPQINNASPGVASDSEDSCLVMDVPAGDGGHEGERITPGEDSRSPSSEPVQDGGANLTAEHSSERDVNGEKQGKPPLKITLRRISAPPASVGEKTPGMFSPLPQEKAPPEKKPKFICQTCGAKYNYVNGLREHESRHRVDLPFECGVCHLKYKTQGMLSRHQAQKNHQVA